jgi:hypothetical protein
MKGTERKNEERGKKKKEKRKQEKGKKKKESVTSNRCYLANPCVLGAECLVLMWCKNSWC